MIFGHSSGSVVSGFLSKMVKSAFLPTSIDPISLSRPKDQAASIVIAFRACIGVILSFGLLILPCLVFLVMWALAATSGCGGASGASECNVV